MTPADERTTEPNSDEAAADIEQRDAAALKAGFDGELPEYMTSTEPMRIWPSALDLERSKD